MAASVVPVYLEVGQKRTFACAVDWPGWCRSGRDDSQALAALAEKASRYAVVAAAAGLDFSSAGAVEFEVVSRLAGSGTTDFGAPDKVAPGDATPLSVEEAARLASIVDASWRLFDRTVGRAPPELAKGPRGGGRDRDRIVDHVLAAEAAYARRIGLRLRAPAASDAAALAAFRNAILDVLGAPSSGPSPEKGWPVRYAARRIAWHVLDHAWEIEDRGGLKPEQA